MMRGYYVDVGAWAPSSTVWTQAVDTLSDQEQQQIQRFVFTKDQRLALASRLLQRHLIHTTFEVPWKEIAIERTLEGKPYWRRHDTTDRPCWNYNVSHHGTVVAIAAHPTQLVGVDVMQLSERPRGKRNEPNEFFRAFQDYFTPLEWEYIRRSSEPRQQFESFYRLWSLKESYIKAVGIGLGFELLRAEFAPVVSETTDVWHMRLDGVRATQWQFESHDVETAAEDPHVISVALGPIAEMWKPELSSVLPHVPTSALASQSQSWSSEEQQVAWEAITLEQLIAQSTR
ncbi:hypothetical protein Poli38472_001823 [Pythium oligandrum]|uniref:holo-[acyl-carrier-protein] synthase n=1 Tax=Pythium oligandrum TaxID=41045 RepID=A0A8K1CTJ2_PYTOL|nr:hypothetical protein Poli38472_001823 [Pythium oligandrum]|eukprot:TMW69667.1 hypothetical protein Poli38472_001823 [Pythium oligandrum]